MPRPRLRSDDEVLDAVGRVVCQRGPGRLTLADVGEAVGLSAATLVQRFGSRQKLLLAFAEREAVRVGPRFARAREASKGALGALRRALALGWEGMDDRVAVANSLAFFLEDLRDEGLRAAARAVAVRLEVEVTRLLDEAVAEGCLPAQDTARLARTVLAAHEGAVLAWALRGEGPLEPWAWDTVGPVLGVERFKE